MEGEYCSDCKTNTEVVHDHSSGDTICTECGLVLESRFIEERAEWRSFAPEPNELLHDPVRVGHRMNPLVTSGGLGTIITKKPSSSRSEASSEILTSARKMWQLKDDEKDGHVLYAFRIMDDMAEKLELLEIITDHAKEIYKKAEDGKVLGKNKTMKRVIGGIAACLYLACQEEGVPRTLKELHGVCDDGVEMKDIYKASVMLKEKLEVGGGTTRAKDIARRHCSTLGLNNHIVKAVLETLQKSEEFDLRRNTISILAAAIYMLTQLSENKIDPQGMGLILNSLLHIYIYIYAQIQHVIIRLEIRSVSSSVRL